VKTKTAAFRPYLALVASHGQEHHPHQALHQLQLPLSQATQPDQFLRQWKLEDSTPVARKELSGWAFGNIYLFVNSVFSRSRLLDLVKCMARLAERTEASRQVHSFYSYFL